MNIRFKYLYRDAGNFKNWNEVIFTNKKSHSINWLEQQARNILIDSEFFVADKAGIPNLFFEEYLTSLDHDWHEFNLFETVSEKVNDSLERDIEDFMQALNYASKI